MTVSIGIFAHNEESAIVHMLGDLCRQDIFAHHECEVIVLENGSSDNQTSSLGTNKTPQFS